MEQITQDNRQRFRYELLLGEDVAAIVNYQQLNDDQISLDLTEVVPSRRGEGPGSTLVGNVLDDARRMELSVVPSSRAASAVRSPRACTVVCGRKHARKHSPAEVDSPLARRRYDLRHACVTTWLNAGVDPAQVAEWAGHSVAVLLRVYVRCIVGRDEIAKKRIERALEDDTES